MFALRRAGGVEQAWLGEQDKRSAGVVRFPRRDLFERAPQMYRTGAPAGLCGPGDRSVERPIQLEDARAVAVTRERLRVTVRETRARQREQLARGDVAHHQRRVGQRVYT